MGPPPLETEHGWLVVYHGVRQTVAGGLYRAGLALLDLDEPARVLRRSDEWVLGPGADYEVSGDVPNVVFPCGLVHHRDTDTLYLYYGAADTRIGLATAQLLGRPRLPAGLPAGLRRRTGSRSTRAARMHRRVRSIEPAASWTEVCSG